jgi:hypothetical protein
MSGLRIVPIGLAEANAFVGIEHRHNKRVPGAKFAIGWRSWRALRPAHSTRPIGPK